MPARVETVGKIEVVGTAEVEIRKIGDEGAELNDFERIAGVEPAEFAERIREAAAARCRVSDCQLRVVCEDEESKGETDGDGGPNPGFEYAIRDVKARVTCDRSDTRRACTGAIKSTTKLIQGFFDGVKGFDSNVSGAQREHMQPAEAQARVILSAAETEAAGVIQAAENGLDAVAAGVLAEFRNYFNLAPPTE